MLDTRKNWLALTSWLQPGAFEFSALELVEGLAALVPPPRKNQMG